MAKPRLTTLAAALLAATASFGASAQTSYNLIDDSGFEQGKSGFVPNQTGTSVKLTTTNALAGKQSLLIGIKGYGDSILWAGKTLEGFPVRRSALLSASMRMRATVGSKSKILVCGLVDYDNGESTQNCSRVAGTIGDKGTVSVSVPLDASLDIQRVRIGVFQEGSAAISGLQLDSVFASLDGVAPAPVQAPANQSSADSANLVSDGGFEAGPSGFGANQSGTYANVVMTGAIAGAQSLSVGMAGYGDSVLWTGREASQLSARRSNNYTVSARVRMTGDSSSSLQLCAMATYTFGGDLQKCFSISGSAGDKGTVTVSMPLDPAKDLDLVRLGLFQEGSEALNNVLVDNVSALLAGVTPVSTPEPGPGNPGNPGTPDTPDTPPVTGGTAYPGYTYTLPEQRPFISMAQYAAPSQSSPAFQRLQGQVDDVVATTANLPSNATYAQLVAAINANHWGYSATDSVVMHQLTGDAKYIQQAVRMADLFVASEEAKIAVGALPVVAGDHYLEAGYYLEQVALAYDHGYELIPAARRTAWQNYMNRAISNIWSPDSASWGGRAASWDGWSINDPGNNYYYSFLKATMLWSLASRSSEWMSFLQQQKFTQLVPFLSILNGGGSREGTGYGTALGSMFENYLYWKGSTGEDLSALSSHARDTVDYWIHATVPTMDYFAAIGDQARSSLPLVFDYQRKLVLEGMALTPSSDAAKRGAWWLKRAKLTDGGNGYVVDRMRYNYDYRYDLLARPDEEQAPTALSYDASGAGALFARSDWSENASWLSFIAGVYDQSHAHQEQGSFSLYRNGWLAVTPNIYSHSGLHQEVSAHSVVRFENNGAPISQNLSASTRTVNDAGDVLTVSANLTPAYSSHSQQVQSWTRKLEYQRSQHAVTVHDQCQVAASVRPIWQLQLANRPVVQGDGSIVAGKLVIRPVIPAAPAVKIVDMTSISSTEFSGGYRLELSSPGGCEYKVEMKML